jgi:general secretion pathway protein D
MTQKELVPVLESIIESMDVKLSQVLIETMILQVQLSDEISTGIDWVTGPANRYRQGLSGGAGNVNIGQVGLLDTAKKKAADMITPGSAGAHYYAVSKALDIGAVISASKTDSRTKLVASPIIMTVDNKEATIEATKMRYLLKGYTYSGSTYNGSAVPDYEQKEIGLTVKVTPKINPNGTVMLEVEEEFSALGESQTIQAATGGTTNINGSSQQAISGIQVETTVTRKLSADITVDNRQTVILGGLTQTEIKKEDAGIPILKDIPWIGRYLFGSTKDTESRQELLMFLTPYVLDDADSAVAEANRRKQTLSDARPWDDHGWSDSPLADPTSLKEQLKRKQREWEKQDEEYKIQLKLEEKNNERVKELKERAQKETERRAKEAAELVKEINKAEEKAAEEKAVKEAAENKENHLLNVLKKEKQEAEAAK